mgnify:CR=1 FL=1
MRNSSAKEGTDNIVKQEKTKLGKFEMQLLAYAQLRKKELKAQINTELKPVLRPVDFESFDLDRAFSLVTQIVENYE